MAAVATTPRRRNPSLPTLSSVPIGVASVSTSEVVAAGSIAALPVRCTRAAPTYLLEGHNVAPEECRYLRVRAAASDSGLGVGDTLLVHAQREPAAGVCRRVYLVLLDGRLALRCVERDPGTGELVIESAPVTVRHEPLRIPATQAARCEILAPVICHSTSYGSGPA